MAKNIRAIVGVPRNLPGIALLCLCLILWLAGGASRADAFGQVIVRTFAWMLLIWAVFTGRSFNLKAVAPIVIFLAAAGILLLAQLLPLPPTMWIELPGRDLFASVSQTLERPLPWRPLSISPGATVNALSSLIVPLTVAALMAMDGAKTNHRLVGFLLALIVLSALIGLVQFSGKPVPNPFVNGDPTWVRGTFANRNHFAVFIAIGCLLSFAWAFQDDEVKKWRAAVLVGLILVFTLIILASGSRAGIASAAIAISLGVLLVRDKLMEMLRVNSGVVFAVAIGAFSLAIAMSILLGRAVTVERAIAMEGQGGLRAQSLPVIMKMVQGYMPFGTGFGTFEQVYRISEPMDLLSTSYLNRAHNDFLEIALDGGLAGIALIFAMVVFWIRSSISAWRGRPDSGHVLPRLGSAIMLVIGFASLVDYPARTPLMMALLTVAAVWLYDSRSPDVN